MKWQPIELAPKDGTRVLLWYPMLVCKEHIGSWNHTQRYLNGKLESEDESWSIGGVMSFLQDKPQPTHWSPLLGPPDDAMTMDTGVAVA